MGAGTFLGFSSLLWMHPVKAFIALAFSHAVEYMVFVWAFQRRRYQHSAAPPSPMKRLVQSGVLYYLPFTVLLGALSAGHFLAGRTVVPGAPPTPGLSLSLTRWYNRLRGLRLARAFLYGWLPVEDARAGGAEGDLNKR